MSEKNKENSVIRRLAAPVALVAASVALAACGGEAEPSAEIQQIDNFVEELRLPDGYSVNKIDQGCDDLISTISFDCDKVRSVSVVYPDVTVKEKINEAFKDTEWTEETPTLILEQARFSKEVGGEEYIASISTPAQGDPKELLAGAMGIEPLKLSAKLTISHRP